MNKPVRDSLAMTGEVTLIGAWALYCVQNCPEASADASCRESTADRRREGKDHCCTTRERQASDSAGDQPA